MDAPHLGPEEATEITIPVGAPPLLTRTYIIRFMARFLGDVAIIDTDEGRMAVLPPLGIAEISVREATEGDE